jgi:predicted phosphodiesterase
VFDAFQDRGVELIVHIGHYGHPGLLNRLDALAPTIALSTSLDEKAVSALQGKEAARVSGMRRVLEAGGLRIGLEFDFSGNGFKTNPDDPPIRLDGRRLSEVLIEKFGAHVDVVAYANQHVDHVCYAEGVLMFNPGSPNLPGGDRKGGLGTVAVLRIDGGIAELEIVDLERQRRMQGAAG